MRADLPAPPRIPDYELLREIGRGSYGVVWLARGVTGLYRAVKIVWRASFEEPQPYEREFRGIREFAAISLHTPRQLALLHVGRDDAAGFFYYVMELADDAETGRDIDPARYRPNTLKDFHRRRGRLPAAEALALGVELAEGLAELHRHGLVHRDIKPSNIIFAGGAPKLADVGLIASARAADLTISRVGNPGYMPPDFPGTPSADAYGLGKVLYELALGRSRDDFPALPPELGVFPDRKELLELNEILLRACAPQSERRYPHATALLEDLRLLQAGKSVRRLRAAERRLGRALRFAAVLGVVAAVAGAGAWMAWRVAQREMTLRAEAEAERDELARRNIYIAKLAQAQRALEQEDYGRARLALDELKPAPGEQDRRGFEWRALWNAAQGDPSEIIRADGPPIEKIALSPDGTQLAVHDADRMLVVYDTARRMERYRIAGVQHFVGFSRHGRWLIGSVLAPADRSALLTLQRWQSSNGEPSNRLLMHEGERLLGARGDDQVVGFRTATSGRAPALVVWSFSAGVAISTVPFDEPGDPTSWRFYRAALSSDGREIMIACVQGQSPAVRFRTSHVVLGDTPHCSHHEPLFRPGAIGWLDVREGEPAWWMSDPSRGEVAVFEPTNSRWTPAEQVLPAASVMAHLPEPKGSGLRVAAENATIAVFRGTGSRTAIRRVHGHSGPIVDFAITPDGATLFSADSNGQLRAWSRSTLLHNRAERQGWDIRSNSTPIAYSDDGRHLYTPGGNEIIVLNAATLESVGSIPGMRHALRAVGNNVWGLRADHRAIVRWDTTNQVVAATIGESPATINQAAFSPNGRTLCFTRNNGQLCVGAVESGALTEIPGTHQNLWPLLVSDDGTRLWSTGVERQLACRALPSGVMQWSVPITNAVVSYLSRSPSGREIVASAEDGSVRVFNADDGRLLRQLSFAGRAVEAALLLPNQARLLAIDIDGDVHCFDTGSWARLGLVPTHARTKPYSVALSPDARQLAVLTVTGTLHVLRAQ